MNEISSCSVYNNFFRFSILLNISINTLKSNRRENKETLYMYVLQQTYRHSLILNKIKARGTKKTLVKLKTDGRKPYIL